MKIVHFDSGLGNQMSIYAEYLAMKSVNPNDNFYMENISYLIPECNEILSMWNGYELEKIFNIHIPNISELFNKKEWQEILAEVNNSKFWLYNWDYPNAILSPLNKRGLNVKNMCRSNFLPDPSFTRRNVKNLLKFLRNLRLINPLVRYGMNIFEDQIIKKISRRDRLFFRTDENIFFGQTGWFLYRNNGIENIEHQLKKDFSFPLIKDKKNQELEKMIKNSNSIAVHARRGDMLSYNGYCYKNGYFRRSIKFIKEKVENPVFFFFCDPGSINWIKKNLSLFNLNLNNDEFYFVDWNRDASSYIDMQLMSYCKHNIITNSSFGWWAAWLNKNPKKITSSPDIRLNTTNHF